MMHNNWAQFWAQVAILVPVFLVSISFHEYAHALAATLLGDDTARKQGRLTLNPLAHVDLLGLVFLVLFSFGWANPVPFDYRNFKYPRLFAVMTALAGPLTNFILAFISLVIINHIPETIFAPALYISVIQILQANAWVNIMLGVFNLLPIPPLDGSHVLSVFLINRFPTFVAMLYRYSLFILLIVFMLPQMRELLLTLIIAVENVIKSLVF